MSWRATAHVKALRGLTPAQRIVAFTLADYHNDEDHAAWPSVSKVAEDCEMPARSVRRALSDLANAGYIAVERRPSADGTFRTNLYRFVGLDIPASIVPTPPPDLSSPHPDMTSGDPDESSTKPGVTPYREPPIEPPIERAPARASAADASPPTKPQSKTANPKRGTQVPESWEPDAKLRAQLSAKHPRVDLDREVEKFRNYYRAKGSTFKKIDSAFRNWVIKAEEYSNVSAARPQAQHFQMGGTGRVVG